MYSRHRAKIKNSFRWGGEIRAAAAGYERTLTVVNISFGGRVLTTRAYDSGFRNQIAGHCRFVIVDPDIDGRNRAAKLRRDRIVGSDIDNRGENATMRIAAVGIDDPFLAPCRFDFDAAGVDLDDREIELPVERPARDQLLEFFERYRCISHTCSVFKGAKLIIMRAVELRKLPKVGFFRPSLRGI